VPQPAKTRELADGTRSVPATFELNQVPLGQRPGHLTLQSLHPGIRFVPAWQLHLTERVCQSSNPKDPNPW